MSKNLKKMISYYKPYLGVFWADIFCNGICGGRACDPACDPLCDIYINLYGTAGDFRTDPLDCAYVIRTGGGRLLQPFFYCKSGACDGR